MSVTLHPLPQRIALSVPEVAAKLGISDEAIYAWIREGRCPFAYVRAGRRILVNPDALTAYLARDDRDPQEAPHASAR